MEFRGKRLSLTSWLGKAARPSVRLHPVSQLRLTAAHSLHAVDFEGRRLLVLCHPRGGEMLVDLPVAQNVERAG